MTPAELETTVRAVAANLNDQRLAAQQAEMQCDASRSVLSTSSGTLHNITTALLKSVGKRERDVSRELVETINNVAAVLTGEAQKLGLQAVSLDTLEKVLAAQVETLNRVAPQIGALVPPPVVEPPPVEPPPVVTSTALFDDTFANGARSGAKNGVSYGNAEVGQGSGDAIAVKPNTRSASGYSLDFTYGGNPDLVDDARIEQWFKMPTLKAVWIGMLIETPLNYKHRDATGADNNKLLRLFDVQYSPSVVHVGMSTLPKAPATTSQMIVEYKSSETGFTGNYGTGPWNLCFTPGSIEPVEFFAQCPSAPGAKDGVITVKWKGAQVYHRADLPLASSGVAGGVNAFLNGYLFGWSNSGFTETTTVRLHRFIVSTKPITW